MLKAAHDEENINAATHAFGVAFGIGAAVALLVVAGRRGGLWQVVGCSIYAFTLLAAYTASTLSHVFRDARRRHAWRVIDQATIYLFMAGTYTPVALTYLRHGPWWALNALIWSIALAGFLSKALFVHRVQFGAVSITFYVVLGWLPVLAVRPLLAVLPAPLMLWYLAGGLCYMAGTIFFQLDQRIRYFHAAWHLMVICGTTCQYIAILLYCTRPA